MCFIKGKVATFEGTCDVSLLHGRGHTEKIVLFTGLLNFLCYRHRSVCYEDRVLCAYDRSSVLTTEKFRKYKKESLGALWIKSSVIRKYYFLRDYDISGNSIVGDAIHHFIHLNSCKTIDIWTTFGSQELFFLAHAENLLSTYR